MLNPNIYRYFFIGFLSLACCKGDCVLENYSHKDGKLESKFTYPDCDDRTTYTKTTFHKNGQVASIGKYRNSTKHGDFTSWYENGQVSAKWQVKNGKETGFIQCWYENGKKMKECRLVNGVETGKEIIWYNDGQLQSEGSYKNGKKNGRWVYWDGKGGMKIRNYINGVLNGHTYERFFDSAAAKLQIVTGYYKDGTENGVWRWFDADSVLQSEVKCVNGINGEYIRYYPSGKVKEKSTLKDGVFDEVLTIYDESGKVLKSKTQIGDTLIH